MINLYKVIYNFFDKLEDKIRNRLTHFPLIYAFIGSIGIVSIWRGIWVIEDQLALSGFDSLLIGVIITMLTGLFVSFFIGDNIIISGLNQEKRIDEKTEKEIRSERNVLTKISQDLEDIKENLID